MKKIFYIYLDRTAEEVPRVFYVGKGQENRIKYGTRNRYWNKIANKYEYQRIVLMATKDEDFAFQEEIRLIKEYKTFEAGWEDGSGWGANLTIGGDGSSGRVVSEETKKLMSEKMTGRKGHSPSKETRKKIGDAGRGDKSWNWGGKNTTDEMRKNMSLSKTGEKHNFAKLTDKQVIEIREKYFSGKYSQKKLGEKYGVSKGAILHIVTNRNWTHLPISEEYVQFLQFSREAQNNGYQTDITIQKIIENTPRGENHPKVKLKEMQVNNIRKEYLTGNYTHRSLAKKYNVSKGCITRILMNTSWGHILDKGK